MYSLRDGIGLRGYGQRDPKKEYQKEGFEYFLELMSSIKSNVVNKMFRFEIHHEDEVERLEAQRRKRVQESQEKMRASHAASQSAAAQAAGASAEDEEAEGDVAGAAPAATRKQRRRAAATGQAVSQAPVPSTAPVKREGPKLGRNDPCWCGSGKKYKACHLRAE